MKILKFGIAVGAAHIGMTALLSVLLMSNGSLGWRSLVSHETDFSKLSILAATQESDRISVLIHSLVSGSIPLAVASSAFLTASFQHFKVRNCTGDFWLVSVFAVVVNGYLSRVFALNSVGLVAPLLAATIALVLHTGMRDMRPAKMLALQGAILPPLPGFQWSTCATGALVGVTFWLCAVGFREFMNRRLCRANRATLDVPRLEPKVTMVDETFSLFKRGQE